jgi:hypothetical protein
MEHALRILDGGRTGIATLATLLTVALIPIGCGSGSPEAVDIAYKQVGACNGYDIGNGIVSAGPNAAYVIFAVHAIDTRFASASFPFDPASLFVSRGTNPHMDSGLQLNRDVLGPFELAPTAIPPRQIYGLNGFAAAVVPTAATDGASEANRTAYPLGHDSIAGFSVHFTKSNVNQTTWPYTPDCKTVQLSAT